MEIKVRIMPPRKQRAFMEMDRKSLYPFLTSSEMKEWMDDEGHLATQWFIVEDEQERMLGGAAWEVYDIHQYPSHPEKLIILDLLCFFIEEKHRGQGLGRRLFVDSLNMVRERLEKEGFVVGAVKIETYAAAGFYAKALSSLGYNYSKMESSMNPNGDELVTIFFVPLLRQDSQR